MPTTNLLQTNLTEEGGLVMAQVHYGAVKSHVICEVLDERQTPGGIYRKISIKQSSDTYSGLDPKTPQITEEKINTLPNVL